MKFDQAPKINKKSKTFSAENIENIDDFEGILSHQKYQEEILPIIEILKPDDLSLDKYEQPVIRDLFDSVKKQQIARGILLKSPEEIIDEVKNLLNSHLKQVLKDARNYSLKVKLDEDFIKKAKIALLFENDMTDAKNSSYMEGGKIPKIVELRNYIMGHSDNKKFTEGDIESLMKTKYKKSLTSVYNDHMYYLGSYGTLNKIPKSLMIGLVHAEEENRQHNHYWPIKAGLESAEKGKYDNECLEQLLASGYTKPILENIDKFQGKPLEKILKSGVPNERDAVNILISLNLPKEEFEKYFDIIVRHNMGDEIVRRMGGSNDEELGSVILKYEDTLNKLYEINSGHLVNNPQDLKIIKDIINKGEVGIVLAVYKAKEYIKTYADTDYDNFLNNIKTYDQEHLVLKYLKDEDKVEYVHKLISQGEEYQIVKLHKSFEEHSLGFEIFNAIKNKNFVCSLKGDLSHFKELPKEEALEFICSDRASIFIDNIASFNFTEEFLQDEKVQEACFAEFNKEIMTHYPSKARIISEKIPFPKEKLDQAVLEAIKIKWIDNNRNDWARSVIYQFPEIKKLLDNPEDNERAIEELKSQFKNDIKSGYAEGIAEILECFSIPNNFLDNKEINNSIVSTIIRDFLGAGNYNNDIFKDLKGCFQVAERISKFVTLPEFILEIKQTVEEIKLLEFGRESDIKKELVKMVIVSEKPKELYEKSLLLLDEIKNNKQITFDKDIALTYIYKFINGGTEEEKINFPKQIKEDVKTISQNKKIEKKDDNKNYYKYILKEVYPERNYDTYKNIESYEDRSSDLDKYIFNRDGYELKLSGVVGYKLKDGVMEDELLISDFSKRINLIKSIASHDKITEFLNQNIENSKAESIEGKILEYFKERGYTVDTMNVLLAYQLLGKYDDFVSNSADRVSSEKEQTSKNYILLDELVNQYGDSMKETIKIIQEKVSNSKDKDIFSDDFIEKYSKKYDKAFSIIVDDLKKIPREKISDQTIQKKILKTLNNIFQGVEMVQTRSNYFSSLFNINDLDNLRDVWGRHINELFVIDEKNNIDVQKIESLQSSVFTKLQFEINKYEEIKEVDIDRNEAKLKKERIIKGYFSKNKENAHARMVADICLANDPNMLKNEKYFEFVLFDEERKKCMGTTMLLEMNEPEDKEKYLLYCPNPSVGLVSEVSAKRLYNLITKQIISFAKDNNFNGILVNSTHGQSTNRAGLFQQSLEQSCLKDESGKEIIKDLKHNHTLSSSYSYQKNLKVVWKNN